MPVIQIHGMGVPPISPRSQKPFECHPPSAKIPGKIAPPHPVYSANPRHAFLISMSVPAIEIRDLRVDYGNFVAVNDVPAAVGSNRKTLSLLVLLAPLSRSVDT